MKLLNLQKTSLPGKSLLLMISLLLGLLSIPALGQTGTTSNCKSDFSFKVDHESLTAGFQARSNRTPAVFGWEISDGSSYRGQTIRHTFSAPGTYKVCLTTIAFDSTSNQRCTTRVCKAVEVVDCDRLEAKFDYVVDGMSIKVRGTSNSNHAVYGYKFGDGSAERGQIAKHTYSSRGVYSVCFIVKDTIYGCVTEVCKRVLIDPCTLRAKFDYRQDGKDFKFYAKANDSNARYVWDFGDGNTATGDQVGHSYQRPGVYIVCLKVLSKTGAIICDFKTCERVEVPNKGCDLEAIFDFRQDGKDFKFFAKANQTPARFVWDLGDGNKAYGDEIKHSYDKPGVYEVCLTVYSAATNSSQICSTKICKRVVVKRPDRPCDIKADFYVRTHGKNIQVIARANQDSLLYFWSFGDMKDGTGKIAKHRYKDFGTYEICLIVFNPRTKCKVCVCKTIVLEKPCNLKADFRWRTNKNLVYFKARSNGSNGTKYYWDFGDGSRGIGEKVRHRYNQRGVYQVTLLVVDPRSQCTVRVSYKIYIGVRSQVNALRTEDNSSSDHEEQPDQIRPDWSASVNPSPAKSTVSFTSKDKTLDKVKIYSSDGALALEITDQLEQADISKLPKGFYYAHVYATDGTLTIVKFLKE